jgi:uncharacterized protein (TIGR03000 family)
MFHHMLSFGGRLAQVGTVVLLTAGPGLAQRQSSGGPSPIYAGGSLSSRYSNGGYYGSSVPVQSQYHPTNSNYGWTHYYNYYPHYGESRYGYPYYSYNYGYPLNPTYGYSGSYLESSPDGSGSPSGGHSLSAPNYVPSGGLPLQYPPPTDAPNTPPAQPTPADIKVTVPANAEVWFDQTKMTSTGPVREYRTPPLAPGRPYSYQVRARWEENGHEVTRTQTISFVAGKQTVVNFSTKGQTGTTASTPEVTSAP